MDKKNARANDAIRRAAGRQVDDGEPPELTPEQEQNRKMSDRIRRAAGRLPAEVAK